MPGIPSNVRSTGSCVREQHVASRRMFLQGALAGGMAFGGFGRLFAAEQAERARRQQKHVILLFMSGGPSQFETWDPKPGRPTGGPHLSIPTSIPGVHFDEYLPNVARLAKRMVTIRSMTSEIGDHSQAGFHTQTAYKPSRIVAPPPHWLSICAHERPSPKPEIPSYVMLGRENDPVHVPGAGFLGPEYDGLLCPGNGEGPQNVPDDPADALSALERKDRLRQQIGRRFARGRDRRLTERHESTFESMRRLLAGHAMFDLEREPEQDFERYGTSRFGRDCLLARRLVEHGVPFVRVQHQRGLAWDKHRRAFDSQRHISSEFDRAVGALTQDLFDRGLWEHTLLILMGEFGRTPEIRGQGQPGRNHWTKSWSLAFGGCGAAEGVVVGSTNDDGTDVADRPVTIPDLFCTYYRLLGLDPHHELYFEGRPIPLVENKLGEALPEALGS